RVVASSQPPSQHTTRNFKKVPRPPEQLKLRTGDRVRIEVLAYQTGYVTVFNVGPTGNVIPLFPDEPPTTTTPPHVQAGQTLHILDVELEPPTGRERLFAVWTRQPVNLSLQEMHQLADSRTPLSPQYRATRNMVKLKKQLE